MSTSTGIDNHTAEAIEPERRATIRAEVASASKITAPLWPADTFIAVNPLWGLFDRPFEEAVRIARRELGANGYRPIDQFRVDLNEGRITREQIREALLASVAGADSLRAIAGPEGAIDPVELLVADVISGAGDPSGGRLLSAAARCDSLLGTEVAETVDRLVAGWLAAYTDEGGSAWRMPGGRDGLYPAFKVIAARDRGLKRLVGATRTALLDSLPDHAEDAIEAALIELRVPASRRAEEIRAQLARLPGWAGLVKWRTEWAAPDTTAPGIDLVDLVAVRLTVESLAVGAALEAASDLTPADFAAAAESQPAAPVDSSERLEAALLQLGVTPDALTGDARAQAHATLARIGEGDHLAVWLAAQEIAYRDSLLAMVTPGRSSDGRTAERLGDRPTAQAVFCIDVRSEGIRRNLEAVSSCETLGFAGFFAVAIRWRQLGSPKADPSCPVLLSPTNDVEERPAVGSERQSTDALQARAGTEALSHAFHGAKEGVASPFVLAEAGGLVAGPVGILRTYATKLMTGLHRWGVGKTTPVTELKVTADSGDSIGFGEEEQVLFAHAALTMMGLTERFGRLVALCAHGSHTVNNPYASSLDCGACGGNAGGPNARVAAAILNRGPVRKALVEQGIEIPADTWFIAAEHDTTSDVVTVLDRDLVPASHAEDLTRLEAELVLAGDNLTKERALRIPGATVDTDTAKMATRGNDWAQVRPEWGLAGNAAFIIGPREMTEGLDLGCRTFLHSYRAECDPEGSGLEVILTAPLVVAQWINSQYYFSSVDPEVFGAGDKTLHNVTGAKAILQGGGGDLQVGLPWQSVAVGDDLVHEPMRLLALVEAPREQVERIIAENGVLQEMFGGGWVSLVHREDGESDWSVRSRTGEWSEWAPATTIDNPKPQEVS